MKTKSCIVIGGGGHAKVLIDMLNRNGYNIVGYSALSPSNQEVFRELAYLNAEIDLDSKEFSTIALFNGIGSTGNPKKRKEVFEQWTRKGYPFPAIVHPLAFVADDVRLADGAQVMVGAIVQPSSSVGENSIINTKSSVDHDCFVGNHVHISPGAVLCGDVCVEDEAHIGAGAIIKQGIRVGMGSIVGAGAVVVNNIRPGTTVVGIPAREVSR
ncbi:acetyltransferase [Cohnella cholangitidis]|uniref:Acetyltransferase n=1 Tax=Cohnella cholangitidis TaxID=2598458 RepID=A0A7G5BXL7_9BACL|nr:acetyltransferase [Cohnella cholangitidis]QMV41701.1 acetyltransferase [Cohnella cholangitidis]